MEASEGFRDKLLFFGSIERLHVERVSAHENWFWQTEQDEYGRFITVLHSDVRAGIKLEYNSIGGGYLLLVSRERRPVRLSAIKSLSIIS